MTTELVRRFYDAFNRRDLSSYDRLFTPDCLIEAPGVRLTGVEGARAFDRVWMTALGDGQISNVNMTTSTNIVMCENRFRGRHTGPLVTADGTLPPSNALFDEPYVAVFEFEGDRIKRQTLHFDRLQVIRVLGPADATAHNLEVAQGIYAAYGRRDIQYILDALADDVSWGIDSIANVPPYGILNGKQNVPKFFAAWAEIGEFTKFEARDFVAAGDHVFNTLDYEFRMATTGKTVAYQAMQHFTFKGGKIVRWRGSEDSARTLAAYR